MSPCGHSVCIGGEGCNIEPAVGGVVTLVCSAVLMGMLLVTENDGWLVGVNRAAIEEVMELFLY